MAAAEGTTYPISADQPEVKVETCWSHILDPDPPITTCTDLGPPGSQYDMRDQTGKYGAFLLTDLLSGEECERLIEASEGFGYGYTSYNKKYRGNLRITTMDPSLATALWERIRPFVPTTLEMDGQQWEAVGLNDCWRLAKYFEGDQFQTHCDASYQPDDQHISMYTVNAYLNGAFEGGATRFFPDRKGKSVDLQVKGEAGLCCVFRQPPGACYYHDGAVVEGGTKYCLLYTSPSPRDRTRSRMPSSA
eukprot:TRINITY_DN5270_c0_g1_i1.p1 TRINITY_DN5270_c0_g1~~TRINITY_DN5270_c0_g1_i1.p1  ORF type:complete len:248 (-),score=79.69 TRINITY_DN5270_c0_g1_i1:55-798(-)